MSKLQDPRLRQAVDRQARGDLAGAQALCWQILLDDPRHFDALHLLGVTRSQQGQAAEGSWFIARALEQRPDPTAWFNLAGALTELRRRDEAIACLDRALALQPDDAQGWLSRADLLQLLGRWTEAIESYRRALALQPGLDRAVTGLGKTLVDTDQAPRAVALLRDAMDAGASRSACLVEIGAAQQMLGQTQAAHDAFAEACAAAPDDARPRWMLALVKMPIVAMDASEAPASRVAFAEALEALEAWYAADREGRRDRLEVAWPFYLAYQNRNNRDLLARFGGLRARLLEAWFGFERLPAPTPRRERPIRVGIVSAELGKHSVWDAIVRGWFTHFDPARVALHVFCIGEQQDAATEFARSRAASFTVDRHGAAAWARAIQEARLEVLLYPAIGMEPISANLASLRLAPIQLASWGHPETTGLPTIDGYLSAEAFEPAGAELAYTERLIRLPRLGVSYVPSPVEPIPPDLVTLGLDPARPMLLCAGGPFKYTPEYDDVFVAIASRVPGAQFVFFRASKFAAASNRLVQRLTARFAAEGMDGAAHLRLIPFQPLPRFYGLLAHAALCLDTIGFSGFNTAMHILATGTPLVAYEGAFMRGRLASGPLRQMGLDALVATDIAGFVDIAARIATDTAEQGRLRRDIRARLPALYDDRGAVAALTDEIDRLVQDDRARAQSS